MSLSAEGSAWLCAIGGAILIVPLFSSTCATGFWIHLRQPPPILSLSCFGFSALTAGILRWPPALSDAGKLPVCASTPQDWRIQCVMTAVPSITAPAAFTATDYPSSYLSALSFYETCVESVVDGCLSTISVEACFCSSFSDYYSSAIDCLSSASLIAGTLLSELQSPAYGSEYFSLVSSECSAYYTAPFSATTARTTPHATATLAPNTATPAPIFEPVTISVVSSLPTTTYPTQPVWSGSGDLLAGYCASPEYTLVEAGAIVWWAPIVGCHSDKPDCCPSSFTNDAASTFTSFVASTAPTVTVTIEPSGSSPGDFGNMAVDKCPADYHSLSGGCCPSGYGLWNAAVGAGSSTPCFSVLPTRTTAPPIFELSSQTTAAAAGATSAVVNIVYAVHYPVKRSSGLPHSTVVAIAVSCSIGALLIGALIFLWLWFMRRNKKGTGNSGPNPVTYDQALENQPRSPSITDTMQQVKGDSMVYTEPQSPVFPSPQGFPTFAATESQTQQAAPVYPATVVPTQTPEPVSPVAQVGSPPIPLYQPQELYEPNWAGRHELQQQG